MSIVPLKKITVCLPQSCKDAIDLLHFLGL